MWRTGAHSPHPRFSAAPLTNDVLQTLGRSSRGKRTAAGHCQQNIHHVQPALLLKGDAAPQPSSNSTF